MDNKMMDAVRNINPRKFFLADGNKTIKGIVAKWWWLPSFLARMLMGFVFIQAGWNQLHELNHAKGGSNFSWIVIPPEHRWGVFFPALELICGVLLTFGLRTRFTALLLLGILATSILDAKLRGLTGLDLSALQNFAVIALLAGLCAAGAGSASLDRFLFKNNAPEAD